MLKKSIYVNKETGITSAKITGEYDGKVYVGRGTTSVKPADTFDNATGIRVARIKAYRNRLKYIRADLVEKEKQLSRELEEVRKEIEKVNKHIDAETEKLNKY